MDLDSIREEASRYALTTKLLNLILDELKKALLANKNLILKANKEDTKLNKRQIKIEEMLKIIEIYRDSECELNDDERKIIFYKGDPYLTIHLCLQAVTQRIKILLVQDDFLIGVNEILLKIIENVLKEFKIFNLINVENYSSLELEKIKNDFDEIITIGDTTIYQVLKENESNVKYFPYNNIGLYCDSKDLLKLQDAIYIYATESDYEIEIYYEEKIDEVIDLINSDPLKDTAVLLTKSNKSKEEFEHKIKNKKIIVNENPFKNEVGKIYNYLK